MLSLALVCAVAHSPFVKNNATLELNLNVIECLEGGPVVLDVSITNRGTKRLFVEPCRSLLPASWKLEPRERTDVLSGWAFWTTHFRRDSTRPNAHRATLHKQPRE